MAGLATRRFLLRDFEPGDVLALAGYQADQRFVRAREAAGQETGDPEKLVALFRRWAEDVPRQNYQFAVLERASRGLVGCAGLRTENCPQGEGELGIELSPDWWGRHGAAVEICSGLLDFGFLKLGLLEIVGETTTQNHRAARLAAFLGARLEVPGMLEIQGVSTARKRAIWRFSGQDWRVGADSLLPTSS